MRSAKAYLNRTYKIESRIAAKKARIQYWRDVAESITSSIENVGRSSDVARKIENCSIKIAELEDAILDDISELIDTENEIRLAINSIDNIRYRVILEKRYILHMSFEAIAISEGYTYRWVQSLHKQALTFFEESMLIPENTR